MGKVWLRAEARVRQAQGQVASDAVGTAGLVLASLTTRVQFRRILTLFPRPTTGSSVYDYDSLIFLFQTCSNHFSTIGTPKSIIFLVDHCTRFWV